jgi:holin-like protein
MALLLVALVWRGQSLGVATVAAEGLARHLSLLFVPAGVGVMMYVGQVAAEWMPIAFALLVSTVLAIAATALTFARLLRWQERLESESGE